MNAQGEQLVIEYLQQISDAAARIMIPTRRRQLVADIRDRIEIARRRAGSGDPRTIQQILDRIGDPGEIVDAEVRRDPTALRSSHRVGRVDSVDDDTEWTLPPLDLPGGPAPSGPPPTPAEGLPAGAVEIPVPGVASAVGANAANGEGFTDDDEDEDDEVPSGPVAEQPGTGYTPSPGLREPPVTGPPGGPPTHEIIITETAPVPRPPTAPSLSSYIPALRGRGVDLRRVFGGGPQEMLAVLALLLGALVPPFLFVWLGLLVGYALTLMSRVWLQRDKVVAVIMVPAWVILLFGMGVWARATGRIRGERLHGDQLTGMLGDALPFAPRALAAVAAIYLLWRLTRYRTFPA